MWLPVDSVDRTCEGNNSHTPEMITSIAILNEQYHKLSLLVIVFTANCFNFLVDVRVYHRIRFDD
jgi:hypothetical protein